VLRGCGVPLQRGIAEHDRPTMPTIAKARTVGPAGIEPTTSTV